MPLTKEHVLEQALLLPPPERARLVDDLRRSLEGADDFVDDVVGALDPEIEAAWAVEIERRVHEVESGRVQPLDLAVVLERIERKLAS